jgi:putative flippase GtrA
LTNRTSKADSLQPLFIQFVKFGLVGTVSFLVDVAVLYLLMGGLGVDPYLGRVFSYLTAATTTWALNRSFTFLGHHPEPLHKQWAKFVAVKGLGAGVNYATYAALLASSQSSTLAPFLAVAAGSIAGLSFNFTAAKIFVFRTTRCTYHSPT